MLRKEQVERELKGLRKDNQDKIFREILEQIVKQLAVRK